MVSTAGKAIKWDESEARPMGRDTMGVKGMNVKAGERVLGMEIAPDGSELFVVTERGYGKRTPVGEYPEHHRGGQGVKTIQVTPKKGQLAGMKIVAPAARAHAHLRGGRRHPRARPTTSRKLGRSTQGVKVMNVRETDQRLCDRPGLGRQEEARPRSREGRGGAGATLLEAAGEPTADVIAVDGSDELELRGRGAGCRGVRGRRGRGAGRGRRAGRGVVSVEDGSALPDGLEERVARVKCVLFDLDGTLIDTHRPHPRARCAMRPRWCLGGPMPDEVLMHNVGVPLDRPDGGVRPRSRPRHC